MKDQKHSTDLELRAFSDGTLSESDSERIGKHLLNCPDCRRVVPTPTKERLWATIMTESEVNEILARAERSGGDSIFSEIYSFLNLQSGLLWGVSIFLILMCFSFLLWVNFPNPDTLIVRTIDKEVIEDSPILSPTGTPVNEHPIKPVDPNKLAPKIKPRQNQTEARPTIVKPELPQKKNTNNEKEQFSLTRGGSGKCREENIGLEFTTEKEDFVFKWKKVQNAAKYHLYISDEEEILIDEYETKAETTFVLKKTLDPLKTYLWKIIVTLENGNKIIGASQKFTVKNFETKPIKFEKKNDSGVRCGTSN